MGTVLHDDDRTMEDVKQCCTATIEQCKIGTMLHNRNNTTRWEQCYMIIKDQHNVGTVLHDYDRTIQDGNNIT